MKSFIWMCIGVCITVGIIEFNEYEPVETVQTVFYSVSANEEEVIIESPIPYTSPSGWDSEVDLFCVNNVTYFEKYRGASPLWNTNGTLVRCR